MRRPRQISRTVSICLCSRENGYCADWVGTVAEELLARAIAGDDEDCDDCEDDDDWSE